VLNAEISSVSDSVSQTRLKIVQSPDRIKRTITTMGATVVEEKKMYTVLEMKSRDLQQKANALLTIEKVAMTSSQTEGGFDHISGCSQLCGATSDSS